MLKYLATLPSHANVIVCDHCSTELVFCNRENVESCEPWATSTTQQIDLAFNIFFMVYFFIRVCRFRDLFGLVQLHLGNIVQWWTALYPPLLHWFQKSQYHRYRHVSRGWVRGVWTHPCSSSWSLFARDSICCKRAYAIAIPSVCLSVCLSHGWFMQKRL